VRLKGGNTVHSLQDESRVGETIAGDLLSRRGLVIGSLRVAGGAALAVAVAGSPGLSRTVEAQDDDGGGGGNVGATTTVSASAAAPTRLPNTGVGADGRTGGLLAGLVGLAATGAAAFVMRGTARDERADA
jgi:hypothetical protein